MELLSSALPGSLQARTQIRQAVQERVDGAGRWARVAAAENHDLALERRRVGQGHRPERACLELAGDGGVGEKGDAEPLLDHLLRGVDVVELHDAARDGAGGGRWALPAGPPRSATGPPPPRGGPRGSLLPAAAAPSERSA